MGIQGSTPFRPTERHTAIIKMLLAGEDVDEDKIVDLFFITSKTFHRDMRIVGDVFEENFGVKVTRAGHEFFIEEAKRVSLLEKMISKSLGEANA